MGQDQPTSQEIYLLGELSIYSLVHSEFELTPPVLLAHIWVAGEARSMT